MSKNQVLNLCKDQIVFMYMQMTIIGLTSLAIDQPAYQAQPAQILLTLNTWIDMALLLRLCNLLTFQL